MSLPSFGDVAERLRRSTVVVSTSRRGAGSGIICSGDGTIITNAHVIASGRPRIQLWDGRELSAEIVRVDSVRDLAELRAAAHGLPAATLADSARIRPGELSFAIGNPLGFVGALSVGTIHAIGPMRGLGTANWVQANLRLAPGSSGGPLANASGSVIGINAMVAGRLALAIPSNSVSHFLANGAASLWFGATLAPVHIPSHAGGHFALLVMEVAEGGPAAVASLRAGDLLFGTPDRKFNSGKDFLNEMQATEKGQLRLEFLRGDYTKVRRVTVVLSSGAAVRAQAA